MSDVYFIQKWDLGFVVMEFCPSHSRLVNYERAIVCVNNKSHHNDRYGQERLNESTVLVNQIREGHSVSALS